MALPSGFLDELRARTPLPALIGRRVKLTRSGRQWKGCCPFHGEKTPSFYVYDDHYHCFGCGAHGDGVSFVMQSQGASFIEAVEQLAAEAGLEVPRQAPDAAAAQQRMRDVRAVLDAAAATFQRRLFLPEGAQALAYLRGRGLSDDTIRRFGLGWSGEGRGALTAELGRQDIPPELIQAAGLLTEPADDRPPREMFFNRVMFPIRDRRGRTISFGGRLLGDGQPKYLNGPETAVFAKRRTLYGLEMAAPAARDGATVVAVEGYMDVIALQQAGFAAAVAPLGTALTEEQLGELWRLSPMPVLCFDGDAAGSRAAARAAELALPLLGAERSLKLAAMPAGEDPDSLIRRGGAPAFEAVVKAATPLVEALYDLLRGRAQGTTPEQRAALRARLEAAAGQIRDKVLAAEYRRALLDRFFAARQRKGAPAPIRLPRPAPTPDGGATERCRALLAIVLRHPALLHDVEEAFGALDLPAPLDRLRTALLAWAASAPALDSPALIAHLHATGLATEAAQVLSAVPVPLPACAAPDAQPADAVEGWWHFFGLMNPQRLEAEVAKARHDFQTRWDQASQRRLTALAAALHALRQGETSMESAAP